MMFLVELLNGLRFFIGHISPKNSFMKPLTKAEEKALLEKFQAGDNTAFERLVEHNMRLVAHIAKKYVASGYELDDLISIGSIGLIKGIRSFNSDKSNYLVTYVSRCIDNEILMHLRATRKKRNEISLSETIGTDKEGNEVSLIDILKSNEIAVSDNVEKKIEHKNVLLKMDKVLDEREKKVIILRYGVGGRSPLTQRETAKILNISRSYISRIEKAALNKLRK